MLMCCWEFWVLNLWYQLFSMSLKSVFFDAQSREFKYNRQAFDQKARSMTEKYAQAAASGSVCDGQFQSLANPSAV